MSETTQIAKPGSSDTARFDRGAKRKRILLVEEDGFTRLVLLFLLKLAGFQVDFTSNGALALRKLRSRHPDALLVELKLRGLSGLDLIKTARRDLDFGSRPIYVFTCADLMNRGTRKEVARIATKVFDKRTVTLENLVKALATMLADPPAVGEARSANVAAPSTTVAPVELTVPGEVEEIIEGVRAQSKQFAKCKDAETRAACCTELLSRVCALASCAEAAALRNLARQAKALEAFLNQLCQEKQAYTESALNTVARAVEVMATLMRGPLGKQPTLGQFTAVIVDEAAPSNMAISDAFRHAGMTPISFEEPARAKEHLRSNRADVVVVNVLLPEAHGLAPAQIRELPQHEATPVIFVPESSVSDTRSEELPTSAPRLNMKPLLVKELTMKALNEAQSTPAPAHNPPRVDTPAPTVPVTETTATAASAGSNGASEILGWPVLNEQARVNPAPALPPIIHARESGIAELSPLPAGLQPAGESAELNAGNGNGMPTVLFVEDDPFVLRVYRRHLKREGFHVEVAEDGLLALDMLPQVRPDVIVLDLMLPKLHGLEVLKFIRADVNLKGTPVLVLSNAYLEGLATKANEAGANLGILKTECTPARLVQHLCELTGRPAPVPAPQPVAQEPSSPAAQGEDAEFVETALWDRQAGLQKDAPKEVVLIRQVCLAYIKATAAEERLAQLTELYRRVRFLSARAGLSGMTKIAELCSALEGLLFQIVFKQTEPTTSTFQTIAQAVDCLDRLAQNRDTTFVEPRTKARVLVIDDDAVCNFAMVNALKRANFDVVSVQEPVESLRVLKANCFDLILLDVNMPQLSGFEVCEHLRRMPQYKSVPVIFVTIDAEFQNRARSIVAGGNDLMAKPVCPLELILKVTMHMLNASAKGVSAPAAKDNQPLTWLLETIRHESAVQATEAEPAADAANSLEPINASFAAANSASEPLQQAEPGAAGPEGQAEPSANLPETETDKLQTDDQHLEIFQPTGLQPDASAQLQPESAVEGQASEAEPSATAEAYAGEFAPEAKRDAQSEESASPVASEAAAPVASGQSTPEQQLEELRQECAQQRELAQKYQSERQALALRICDSEMDLSRVQSRLERREKKLEELQQQLEELSAQKPPAATNSAEPAAAPPAEPSEAEKQAQARCAQLEQELAEMRKAREELDGKFAQAQQAAEDAARRAQELEQRLSQSAVELERAQAELAKQKQEMGSAESELRQQLEAANAASRQAETAHQQAQARCAQLEQELAALGQAREALNSQFTQQQQSATDSARRAQEIEQRLGQTAAELERVQAELQKQQQAQTGAESELRQQLEAASAARKQTEAAQQEAQARCGRLEQELADLRKTREELDGKFVREQLASAQAGDRIKELEDYLNKRASELELAKADSEKRSQEHAQLEARLREQHKTAADQAEQAEAAQKQAQERCAQLEQELAGLKQAREELKDKFSHAHETTIISSKRIEELTTALAGEQQAATESRARIQEIERNFASYAAELRRAKAELEQQGKERGRVEAELRQKLETTSASMQQSEAGQKQAQARAAELEQELVELRRARERLKGKYVQAHQAAKKSAKRIEELSGNLTGEQKAAAESRARLQELESLLAAKAAELQRATSELERQTKTRSQTESELRQQLEATSAALKRSEAAQKQAQASSSELEQELAGLRQAREELAGKFGKEQQVVLESRTRITELENRLGATVAELQRAKAELEQQTKERSQAESELRQQLEVAGATIKQSEALQKQTQARAGELEQELAVLRQARQELAGKFGKEQQAATEARQRIKELEGQLDSKAAELQSAKAVVENQARERGRAESELRQQLEAASAAHKQSEAAQKQAQARAGKLEQELTVTRQAWQDVTGKLAKEQQGATESRGLIKDLEAHLSSKSTELQTVKAELEKQANERGRVESELRQQLDTANATIKQTEAAREQAHLQSVQFQQELAGLRRTHEELTVRVEREQHAAAESRARIKELETDLGLNAGKLERAHAELMKQVDERGRAESELRKQLEAAGAAIQQSEAAHKQAQARLGELEQELTGLRQAREELTGRLASEQQAAAESRARVKELERQLQTAATERTAQVGELEQRIRQGVAGLARASAELSQEQGQRQRSEERAAALSTRLQQLHEEFGRTLEAQRASLERITSLEDQLRQSEQSLVRRTADFEQQQAGRQLAEEQLHKAKELNFQFRKNLSFYEAANKTFDRTRQDLETRLAAGLTALQESDARFQRESADRQRLAEKLDALQGELQSQTRKREAAEQELQTTVGALNERGAKLEKEAAERQRVAEALEGTRRDLQYQSRKRETVETELQTTSNVLHEVENRLQQEAAERQRLAEALESAQRALQTQSRNHDTLQQELQSALGAVREAEAKLQQGADERQRLAETLGGAQRESENQSRQREALERELRSTLDTLHDSEARLNQELATRQRLNEALEAAELALRDRSQRSELEHSRLNSDLELERAERKRQETHMARMRHLSLDAVRAARVQRNSLRRQIREPVDKLYDAARGLLELETGGEQKQLAQAILHDVLLVRTRLQEPEMGHRAPADKTEETPKN